MYLSSDTVNALPRSRRRNTLTVHMLTMEYRQTGLNNTAGSLTQEGLDCLPTVVRGRKTPSCQSSLSVSYVSRAERYCIINDNELPIKAPNPAT
jgi:hypothetical protein